MKVRAEKQNEYREGYNRSRNPDMGIKKYEGWIEWVKSKLDEDADGGESGEKDRREYYQGIVYDVCNLIDAQRGDGKKTVCGTLETPSTDLQDTLRALFANCEPKF